MIFAQNNQSLLIYEDEKKKNNTDLQKAFTVYDYR